MTNKIFTSESVTEGHPDKVCDQISDAVLDNILSLDKTAHVACETVCTTGMVLVMGEISTECYVDIPAIARETIKEIGYDRPEYGFDGNSCSVLTAIDEQSPDIAMGVNSAFDDAEEIGAGDQGMMFGFACDETPELMPAPISMAHALSRRLASVRKSGELGFLRPDGKSQVTVRYGETGEVESVPAIVVSTQHSPDVSISALREAVIETVIKPVIPEKLITRDTKFFVNPTGRFVVGGPVGDSGLTGRKIIVDTYGGMASHGGGCFSGKDPTKVDRSAAYMARYIAKNLVAAGLAKRCQIEIAYAIGVARPVSVLVDTFGTGALPDEALAEIVTSRFDMRPASIIRKLDLLRPIYKKTAAYGHFGRTDVDLPWERLDMKETLRGYLN
ncbi:MAG: methionine adenosyltransferase [Oscillospiraceae bacterium]|nr:methionine adenosyltransferase [Oscillospiraceae bacterium]MBQ3986490.1 methionine adenosyltransferase [Oscillospiraceae bacterium]MBQ5567778.1 methionine adenosyltransferase [Oscillospiraceae bacterium]